MSRGAESYKRGQDKVSQGEEGQDMVSQGEGGQGGGETRERPSLRSTSKCFVTLTSVSVSEMKTESNEWT